jgi:ribulose-bisphosphate carboxylase large chain
MGNFEITYRLTVQEQEEVDNKIEEICLEQSVELSREVVNPDIGEKVIGKPILVEQLRKNRYETVISWPTEAVGGEISQFLNILYGNISLQPGIRIVDIKWLDLSPDIFEGPAFGISKIRDQYAISSRPLSATALKPMGSTSSELADKCYQFACGGIDLIKDDHGLADQEFAPFGERVRACVSAIRKAAQKTGRRSYYYPNITAFSTDSIARYEHAADLGADGVLICPHISGLATMHELARHDIDLPIMAHPAFSGQLTTNSSQGLSPGFLYGKLWRALGADFVIYPNKGGRFSFTTAECQSINRAAQNKKSPFKALFPMPGGGIQVDNIEHWLLEYGSDITFLIGGSLYEHPDGLRKASAKFCDKLKQS